MLISFKINVYEISKMKRQLYVRKETKAVLLGCFTSCDWPFTPNHLVMLSNFISLFLIILITLQDLMTFFAHEI